MARHSSNVVERAAKALDLDVIDVIAGGEFGATQVQRGTETLVLKLLPGAQQIDDVARSVGLAGDARAAGCPAPRYVDVGVVNGLAYTLQTFVRGVPPSTLTTTDVAALADVVGKWTEIAGRGGWWGHEMESFLGPADSLGVQAMLRTSSAGAARLAEEITSLFSDRDWSAVRDGTLTHQDFHHGNLLMEDGVLTAVVDWENARIGDTAFDLLTLYFWATAARVLGPAASAGVVDSLRRVSDEESIAAGAAYLAVRNLDFFAREHPDELEERFVPACERLLAPLWRGSD